jgi:hypothetical protein
MTTKNSELCAGCFHKGGATLNRYGFRNCSACVVAAADNSSGGKYIFIQTLGEKKKLVMQTQAKKAP